MEYNPFVHNYRFYGETDVSPLPTFGDTVSASIGYQYMPALDFIKNKIRYGFEHDPSYNPTTDLEGYERFKDQLIHAQNADHMIDLKRQLDANIKRRRVLSESSLTSQFFAGLFDPVNFVALPFGGAAVGIGRSMLRTGASVAAIQGVQEAYRYPLDPLATPMESAINIGSAFAAGGLIGGALSVPVSRRASAIKRTEEVFEELDTGFNPMADPKLPEPTADRPFRQIVGEQLEAIIQIAPKRIQKTTEFRARASQRLDKIRAEHEKAQQILDGFPDKDAPDAKAAKDREFRLFRLRRLQEERIKGMDERIAKDRENLATADSERITRVKEEAEGPITNQYGIAKSAWTDSVFYKFVTTPMKRVLQHPKLQDAVKMIQYKMGADSGMLLNMHRHGGKGGPSIFQRAQQKNGEWVQVHDRLVGLYEREYKLGPQLFPDVDPRSTAQKLQGFAGTRVETYAEWISSVNRKRITGEKPRSDAEAEAMKAIDDYYRTWGERLEQVGMLGGERFYQRQMLWIEQDIADLSKVIADLEKKLDNPQGLSERAVGKLDTQLKRKKEKLERLEKRQQEVEQENQFLKDNEVKPPNEDVFNPRYWDLDAITANRDAFAKILFDWYKSNPFVYVFDESAGKYVLKELRTDTASVNKRVDETIDTILGRRDVTHEDQSFYGANVSKHLRHREIDIPNALVIDFIETNPINVMKAYNQRIAPVYEFEVEFNGRTIDDVLDDADELMVEDGLDFRERNAVLRDIRHMYDRVTTRVLRDPHSWDQTTATVLKDLAMLNYLGTAGLATLPDFAKIMMEHEMGAIMKGLFGVMNDHKVRLSAREARIAGEAIEILQGDAHLRLTEYMTNNPLNNGFMNRVRSGFFLLNGLAPMTNIFKRFDAIMRGHTLIDYSVRWTQGKATKQEIEYLLRYNIDLDEARKIADSPWEQTESGLYLPNSEKWTSKPTTENFRTAMNSGIMNTVLMGTPADKPIAVDGVFYIPMHIAEKFGMKQDPKFRGYARIENGLLGLPFQFMSYSFAAANKITASFAQGQVRNRAVAVTASMGLGYMALSLKQPDFVMDKMSFSDKLARSFDASGIAALYSDLFYTAMNTSLALGGPNIGMGIINPKFPQEENALDAFTGVAGAGPAYAVDVARAVKKLMTGDFDQGVYELTGRLPFATALLWNEEVKELRQALRGGRY
jgi:hypothetical protein